MSLAFPSVKSFLSRVVCVCVLFRCLLLHGIIAGVFGAHPSSPHLCFQQHWCHYFGVKQLSSINVFSFLVFHCKGNFSPSLLVAFKVFPTRGAALSWRRFQAEQPLLRGAFFFLPHPPSLCSLLWSTSFGGLPQLMTTLLHVRPHHPRDQ